MPLAEPADAPISLTLSERPPTMDKNMSQTDAGHRSDEAHREVSTAGKFVGLTIIGSTVLFIIFLEGFGPPEYFPYFKWMMLGALVLGVGLPLLFFRRRAD